MAKDNVYVNFESADFLAARKRLLSGSIDTIRLLKRYKEYKKLRFEEKNLKNELRKEIKEINSGVNDFIESIPRIKEELGERKKRIVGVSKERVIPKARAGTKIKLGRKTKATLDSELADIKAKLASLG